MKHLLIYMSILHLAASDLGFPIRIVPLQKTVKIAIGTGAQPLQSSLQKSSYPYQEFQLAATKKASLVRDVVAAVQTTCRALLGAVTSKSSRTGTFGKLTKALDNANRRLGNVPSVVQYFSDNFGGFQFGVIVGRLVSEHGKIAEFVEILREAAANAGKAGTVTAQNIQKYIGTSQVKTLGDRISAFIEVVRSLVQEVQRFDGRLLDLSNVLDEFRNSTANPVIIPLTALKSLMRTSKIRMKENVEGYVDSITSAFNSVLNETSLKNDSMVKSFRDFVKNVTSDLTALNTIEAYSVNQTNNFTELYLTSMNKSYEQNFESILKAISNSTLDKSIINGCFNAKPLPMKQLLSAQYMGLDCTNHLTRSAPVTRQVVDRFMSIFYTFVMQPITDLTTCNSTLDKQFCEQEFENQNFAPYQRPSKVGMIQMLQAMSLTAFNNADYAVFRMEQCYQYAERVYSRVIAEVSNFISDCVQKKT